MHEGQSQFEETKSDDNNRRQSHSPLTENTNSHEAVIDKGKSARSSTLRAVKNSTFKIDLAKWIEQVYPATAEKPINTYKMAPAHKDAQLHFAVQEDIAKRIAQNLHDDAGQMLAVVCLSLASIARDCPQPTAERLHSVSKQLDEVCDHIRRLSHELRPIALECSGLKSALSLLAQSADKRFSVEVSISGDIDGIPAELEICLYRVVQEALSNVYRHADASHVDIQLRKSDQAVYCTISDNGNGIKRHEFGRSIGLGLIGILERVQTMGGTCILTSRLNKGLSLALEIPR